MRCWVPAGPAQTGKAAFSAEMGGKEERGHVTLGRPAGTVRSGALDSGPPGKRGHGVRWFMERVAT